MFAAKAHENGGQLLVYDEDERNSCRLGHANVAGGSSSGGNEDNMHARWTSREVVWPREVKRE